MTKYVSDGVIQVRYAASISNQAVPTAVEWGAGTDLTAYMRALDTPLEGSQVDAGTADSKYNSTVGGTYGGQPLTYEGTRDKTYASDNGWKTLPRGTTGFLLVARRGGTGASSALQAGDRIDVWPIEVTSRNPLPYGRNELARFSASMAVPTPPSEDVALA